MFNIKKLSAGIITAGMLFTMCAGFATLKQNKITVNSFTAYAIENQSECDTMVVLINNARIARGLKPLKVYPFACSLAAIRAKECATLFSHTRPDGRHWSTVALDVEMPCIALGENLAYNQANNAAVYAFEQFMESPPHEANILNEGFTHVGIGMYKDGGISYFAQLFITQEDGFSGEYIPTDNASAMFIEYAPAILAENAPVILAENAPVMATESVSVIPTENAPVIPTESDPVIQAAPNIESCKYMKGDVDGNGIVDAMDAALVLAYYMTMQTGSNLQISEEFLYAADVNDDNVIDAADAAGILKYYTLISTGKMSHF